MFFDGWFSLFRVLVVGTCAYVALVCLLRVSGKRTLSKLNAFDLVVTVALGSTFATVLLSKDVALLEGVLAFAMLIGFQFVVAWLSVRWPAFGGLVKSEPRLLYYRGQFLRDAMRKERITEGEVLAAVRAQGIAAIEEVEAVVLETASNLSVLKQTPQTASSLRTVRGVPEQ